MENEPAQSQPVEQKSGKKFKDTFFRTLFHERKRAIELCNAVEDANFPDDSPLRFFTQGDRSLARRNNDFTVVINNQLLSITDHQSTLNPNMPLRLLPPVADTLYTWLADKRVLYKNKLVTIPTPKFYVLYNGKEKLEKNVLRLSDAFRFENHDFSMELAVKIIDVNYGSGSEALQKSPSLNGYAYLIDCIRRNMDSGTARDTAIKEAVNRCIQENILAGFLEKHYKEVCDMFDYGITYEEELEIKLEEGMEKGMEKGILKAALKFLQKGTSLEDVIRTLDLSDAQIRDLKSRFA